MPICVTQAICERPFPLSLGRHPLRQLWEVHATWIMDQPLDHPRAIRRDDLPYLRHRHAGPIPLDQRAGAQPPATVAAVACHVQCGQAGGDLAEVNEPQGHLQAPAVTGWAGIAANPAAGGYVGRFVMPR